MQYVNGEEITEISMKDLLDFADEEDLQDKSLKWYEVFSKGNILERNYIRLMLSNKEKLNQEPRIKVSTIHAAKGGEADNVILVLDNANKIRQAVMRSITKSDEEHRVWYVGTTRAKKEYLFITSKNRKEGISIMTDPDGLLKAFPQVKAGRWSHYKNYTFSRTNLFQKIIFRSFQGCVVKYVCRYLKKDKIKD